MMSSDGCSRPPVEVLVEALAAGERRRTAASAGPARCAGSASVWSRIASWSCSGMPSSMPITRIGISAPKSAIRSKPLGADERVERVGAELADLRLEGGDLARREHPRQQAAVDRVGRRVLEDHGARRDLHAGLDQLEHPAATGDEGVAVLQPPLDVVVPARGEEVVRARCSRAAPPRGAAGTPGTGRR